MLDNSQNNFDRVLNLKTNNNHNNNVKLDNAAGIANSQASAKKMKLDDEAATTPRFQCVVCQANKASLSELHWHQTYQHSTEELSLAVIGWRGLVKVIHKSSQPSSQMEKENTEQRSIWNSFSKKPSQFYYLSSSILRVNGEQGDNSETPIDCTIPLEKDKKEIEIIYDSQEDRDRDKDVEDEVQEVEDAVEEVEAEEVESKEKEVQIAMVPKSCSIPLVRVERYIDIPIVSRNGIGVKDEDEESEEDDEEVVFSEEEEELRGFSQSSIDMSSCSRFINLRVFKKELSCTKDISMDDFVRSANGLCEELEVSKRLSALKKSLRRTNRL